jgi:N-acetylneuraminate lyase
MTPKEKFGGIYPALITPFDEHDRVNVKALTDLVEKLIGEGVNGFYVSGSTGEAFLLDDEERKLVYKTVAEANRGRVRLIAQIGAISTKKAIEFAKYAEECGYDAISSLAPFYYKFSFAQVKKYYFDIVDSVNLPMIIYNIPLYSGVSMSLDQIGEFLSDERFIGIKHTANDYFALQQFKRVFPDKVMYNGFDEMFLAGLSMGADGAIGSTYNFMADKFVRILSLFREGKVSEAQKVQFEASNVIAKMVKVGVMEATKELITLQGINVGNVRPPFSVLTDEQKAYVKSEILPML